MTSMPDPTPAPAKEAVIASYEELRCSALRRVGGSGRGIGFALFVRGGMAGWMKRWAALPRQPEAPARRPAAEQPLVPQDFRVEVATLLAEMALSVHARGATVP